MTSEMLQVFLKNYHLCLNHFAFNMNCIYLFTGYLSEYVCVMSFPEILIKPLLDINDCYHLKLSREWNPSCLILIPELVVKTNKMWNYSPAN